MRKASEKSEAPYVGSMASVCAFDPPFVRIAASGPVMDLHRSCDLSRNLQRIFQTGEDDIGSVDHSSRLARIKTSARSMSLCRLVGQS